MTADTPALSIRGLTRDYPGARPALHDLWLDLAPGELLAVVGPSGAGKSTLLRLVAGLDRPSSGEIFVDGQPAGDWSVRQRDVALVFQSHSLFPHLRAFDNMAYGLRLRGTAAPEIAARVTQAAKILGLEALLDRLPRELSGGERQRVALGRALVRRPRFLLLDEPLSSLDAPLRAELRREIVRVHRALGAVTILVTHDQAEALSLADRVAVLDRGTLQQVGPPDDLCERPSNLFVAGFIGATAATLIDGEIAVESGETLFRGAHVVFPLGGAWRDAASARGGRQVVACVRAQHWRFVEGTEGAGVVAGPVEWVERTGWGAVAHVAVGPTLVRAACGERMPRRGEEVALRPELEHVLLFDRATGRALASG